MVSKYPFKPYYPAHEFSNKLGYYHEHMNWKRVPRSLAIWLPFIGINFYFLQGEYNTKHHAVYSRTYWNAVQKQNSSGEE